MNSNDTIIRTFNATKTLLLINIDMVKTTMCFVCCNFILVLRLVFGFKIIQVFGELEQNMEHEQGEKDAST